MSQLTPSDTQTRYVSDLMKWYFYATGRKIDLDNPKTYNDKMQWLKLYASTPDKTRLADKYLVRDWVAEKIGEKYLVKLLGVYDRFEDIDFATLPNRFAIKCNHGCGYNIIVHDKSKLNLRDVKRKLDKWMSETYGVAVGCELHYRDIPHKIIVEQYIENNGGDLYDYKFWCFDGRVEYIQVLSERNLGGLKKVFFDRNWNKHQFEIDKCADTKDWPKPDNLDEMIALAEKLSHGYPHVRVDFYRLDDGSVIFGEMTFTPCGGCRAWKSDAINRMFGDMLKLPELAYDLGTGEYFKLPDDYHKNLNIEFKVPVQHRARRVYRLFGFLPLFSVENR